MPRWRVAGRRCSEYSETQRRRAEPLVRSRKIRFSSSKHFPGKSMAAHWAGVSSQLREIILADDKFKVFCGTANPALADAICRYLGVPRGQSRARAIFSDGETRYQILENVRGADVFVVQPCCNPVDFHLMQLLLMIDAFKRASAWRITPVIPYYPYARQDRKDRPRVAISAKLVADLLETAGASRVLSLDLHAPQIQGYFNIPVDHLYASPVLVEYFQKKKLGPITVVSPDAGGVERARLFAKRIDAPLAIVDKRRIDVNVSEVMHLIGDVAAARRW